MSVAAILDPTNSDSHQTAAPRALQAVGANPGHH